MSLLEKWCQKHHIIAEGKTKIIYSYFGDEVIYKPSDTQAVMFFKDDITAGDGAKKDTIEGKGLIDAQTNANIFRYLNNQGIPTHFLEEDKENPRYQLVKKLQRALPLEVVARRIATGSYLPRNPDAKEGDYFAPLIIEFFYKDDDLHDPMLDPKHIESLSKKTLVFHQADSLVMKVFHYLESAFSRQHHQLIDLKIEVGYPVDSDILVVSDEITAASFRLWPYSNPKQVELVGAHFNANVISQLNREGMLDKQLYREGHPLTEVKNKFERVKILTD